jgi:heme a synthase
VDRLARFSWTVLAYTVGVILWGALVRATGSGAGCGSHWPLCDGEIVPRSPDAEMLIEYSHRVTSGIALLAVVALFVWTFRARPAGHPARRGASWSLFFMLTEAGVGAALVLFQLVADNESMARALFMAIHLLNTFILLAFMALTAWWLSGGAPIVLRGRGPEAFWLAAGALGLLLVGASGAIAALGDTLYPAGSLSEALAADLSPTSHLLIRLRVFHPAIAIVVGAALIGWALRTRYRTLPPTSHWATALALLIAVQLVAGFVNVLLLAPVWMQMLHLLIADAIWITFILLGAILLAERPAERMSLSTEIEPGLAG